MTQTVILTVAILASLLVGWFIDTRYRERIKQLKAEAEALEDVIVEQRRRIWNLTRDEHHA